MGTGQLNMKEVKVPAYTGIGSRETPEEILKIMEDAGWRLARVGYTLRSGGAGGADAAFQRGMQRFHEDCNMTQSPSRLAEIYVPWNNFKGGQGLKDLYNISLNEIDKDFPQHKEMRWDWVKEVHGGWDKLSQGARKLHERNVHQIFGKNLSNAYFMQSKFVIYYAKETRTGNPKGGTATAVNLAKKSGVRTLNLWKEDNITVLENFLVSLESKRGLR